MIDIDHLVEKKSRRKISATPAFEELMSELETTLLEADMGHEAVDEVLMAMRARLIGAPSLRKGS